MYLLSNSEGICDFIQKRPFLNATCLKVTSILYCRMSKLPPAAQIEFPTQAKQQHNSSRPNSSNETTDSQTFHRHNRHSGGCQHNQPPIEVISDHQVEVHQTSNELSSASDADEEDEADEANESLKPIVRRQQPEKQIRKSLTFTLLVMYNVSTYIPIYKKRVG